MIRDCEYCKTPFKTYPSEIKKGAGRFCSRTCAIKFRNRHNPNFGFKTGHKTNIGNSFAHGNTHTDEWKKEASRRMKRNTFGFKKGQRSPRKGKHTNIPAWNKGMKLPQFSGENHPNWIQDRSMVKKSEKKHLDSRYKGWVKDVKDRDGWKCRINNEDCSGRLEAHHILPWRKHRELRFDVNNGITLCKFHHPLKDKDEARLESFYTSIIKNNIPYSEVEI